MESIQMPKIKIDNKDYDTDTLSTEAKQQLQMLSITDSEINRLQAQLAIAQTARISYANDLKAALPAIGDTIKLWWAIYSGGGDCQGRDGWE